MLALEHNESAIRTFNVTVILGIGLRLRVLCLVGESVATVFAGGIALAVKHFLAMLILFEQLAAIGALYVTVVLCIGSGRSMLCSAENGTAIGTDRLTIRVNGLIFVCTFRLLGRLGAVGRVLIVCFVVTASEETQSRHDRSRNEQKL
jgi:hypothetical protein